jgi:hypothetical protein
MKRYPVYKYSGIEWLGEIPADWQLSNSSKLPHAGEQKEVSQ